jgi:ribosomal-protein-alanine N-acetyltransferase
VLPAYRGRGVGTALLLNCERQLPTPAVRLNVRITNRSAIRLYEDNGYIRAGVWPAYYADREDALVMEKSLR